MSRKEKNFFVVIWVWNKEKIYLLSFLFVPQWLRRLFLRKKQKQFTTYYRFLLEVIIYVYKTIHYIVCWWHGVTIKNADGIQRILTCFEQHCDIWTLKVNTEKTKAVTFSKRKAKMSHNFTIFCQNIDVQVSYSYLCISFNYNGNFCNAKNFKNKHKNHCLLFIKKIRN